MSRFAIVLFVVLGVGAWDARAMDKSQCGRGMAPGYFEFTLKPSADGARSDDELADYSITNLVGCTTEKEIRERVLPLTLATLTDLADSKNGSSMIEFDPPTRWRQAFGSNGIRVIGVAGLQGLVYNGESRFIMGDINDPASVGEFYNTRATVLSRLLGTGFEYNQFVIQQIHNRIFTIVNLEVEATGGMSSWAISSSQAFSDLTGVSESENFSTEDEGLWLQGRVNASVGIGFLTGKRCSPYLMARTNAELNRTDLGIAESTIVTAGIEGGYLCRRENSSIMYGGTTLMRREPMTGEMMSIYGLVWHLVGQHFKVDADLLLGSANVDVPTFYGGIPGVFETIATTVRATWQPGTSGFAVSAEAGAGIRRLAGGVGFVDGGELVSTTTRFDWSFRIRGSIPLHISLNRD